MAPAENEYGISGVSEFAAAVSATEAERCEYAQQGSGNSGKDNNSGGSFICGGDKRQGGRELEQCIAADEEKFCTPFGKRRGLQVVIRSIDGTGTRQSPKAELIAGCAEDKVKRRPTETAAERF